MRSSNRKAPSMRAVDYKGVDLCVTGKDGQLWKVAVRGPNKTRFWRRISKKDQELKICSNSTNNPHTKLNSDPIILSHSYFNMIGTLKHASKGIDLTWGLRDQNTNYNNLLNELQKDFINYPSTQSIIESKNGNEKILAYQSNIPSSDIGQEIKYTMLNKFKHNWDKNLEPKFDKTLIQLTTNQFNMKIGLNHKGLPSFHYIVDTNNNPNQLTKMYPFRITFTDLSNQDIDNITPLYYAILNKHLQDNRNCIKEDINNNSNYNGVFFEKVYNRINHESVNTIKSAYTEGSTVVEAKADGALSISRSSSLDLEIKTEVIVRSKSVPSGGLVPEGNDDDKFKKGNYLDFYHNGTYHNMIEVDMLVGYKNDKPIWLHTYDCLCSNN